MADLLLIQIYKTTEHILKYITEFKFVRCVCDMLQSNYKIEMNVFILNMKTAGIVVNITFIH